ncbi:MAG: ATP-dependent DNA helicase RecG [Flavobacteriales bacterium]|nr:MAG: ATP-dependent DNA helicase RecG [Flavobacteriales bacterium]RPF73448.1 MAG: ATP-dependent DNA helicase RecG [Thiotrichales bacterium TMED285]|tara:strand:+ start:713 stop:2812 length:2100 start_codon:yes stop_codon:yes gene_type:complete
MAVLFQKSIDYLKGVGPNRAQLLKNELGINTLQDLLYFFPHRYIDRSQYFSPSQLPKTSAEVQVLGSITHLETVKQKRGSRLVATFSDGQQSVELVWFRGHQWIQKSLQLNKPYIAFGRLNWFGNKCSIAHPELDFLDDHKQRKGNFQAVYPATESLAKSGISQRVIRQIMVHLFEEVENGIQEVLPAHMLKKYHLLDKNVALSAIHFPKNQDQLAQAQYRMKFEELFFVQLQLGLKKLHRKQQLKGIPFPELGHHFNSFFHNHLPFPLTEAQKRVVREIRTDLKSEAQMNRLLQGDVGSGKTIVAVLCMLMALDNGMQATLVAPTEILAQQHFNSINELLKPLDIQVGLLTGSVKKSARTPLLNQLADGSLQILIGTHAVLEQPVAFQQLGLAIVDEQHRFGVAQRAKLWRKNTIPPNVLVMTATPIPRTLAMTAYGDLDLSVIDELPPGRKPITTLHKSDSKRLAIFQFMREEISKGRQVYVVYPLIQESRVLDYKDLMDGYESIAREFPLPQYQVSIVHGKMKAEDKAYEMERFVSGKTQIMVATTVIEVGVNVPNASIMIIESAERFGLSQLHQLRGRVGRGASKSYCVLMTGNKLGQDAQTRIQTMVRTQDGFELAEVDLSLRGPGDLMGTQQSGVLPFLIANLKKDGDVLKAVRHAVDEILLIDSALSQEQHRVLHSALALTQQGKSIWKYIG